MTQLVPSLSDKEFKGLKDLIGKEAGIQISDFKKMFLVSRLLPRLRELGLQNFKEYLRLLESTDFEKAEIGNLINRITTNETRFFRETHHFEYLRREYLPSLVRVDQIPRKFFFWCAGCATGEEAYSLAMILADFRQDHPGIQIRILATDIDSEALNKARAGLFPEKTAEHIPTPLLKKYFLKGVGEWTGWIKAGSLLKGLIAFEHLNLHKPGGFSEGPFEGIFCRNVLIYFLPVSREKILEVFFRRLTSSGLLFLGHSEQLLDKRAIFRPLGNTIYQKIG
ncbi:MAG: CheR family methyltransferase [Pseudomonadota bacterium]